MPKKPKPTKGKFVGLPVHERAKLAGRLGGLARSKNLSQEARKRISAKGGLVTSLRHGPEFYSQMTKNRWNSLSDAEREAECQRLRELSKKHHAKAKREAKSTRKE